jgi:hypothetical protein
MDVCLVELKGLKKGYAKRPVKNTLAKITTAIRTNAPPITNSGFTLGPFVSSWKNLINPALLCGIPGDWSFFFFPLIDVPSRYRQFPLKGLLYRLLCQSSSHEVGEAELLRCLLRDDFVDKYLPQLEIDEFEAVDVILV